MPEKTKREKNSRENKKKETEIFRGGQESDDNENAWSRDQQEKSYYYDDAYGYEVYDAQEDDETESED